MYYFIIPPTPPTLPKPRTICLTVRTRFEGKPRKTEQKRDAKKVKPPKRYSKAKKNPESFPEEGEKWIAPQRRETSSHHHITHTHTHAHEISINSRSQRPSKWATVLVVEQKKRVAWISSRFWRDPPVDRPTLSVFTTWPEKLNTKKSFWRVAKFPVTGQQPKKNDSEMILWGGATKKEADSKGAGV